MSTVVRSLKQVSDALGTAGVVVVGGLAAAFGVSSMYPSCSNSNSNPQGFFAEVCPPFDADGVDVFVTHDGCSDAKMAYAILCDKRGVTKRGNNGPKVVWLPPGASQLPRGTSMDVFKGKNVLVCDVTPQDGLMSSIRAAAAQCFVMDHHNTHVKSTSKIHQCVYTSMASGCMLMWRWLHGDASPPLAVDYLDAADRHDFARWFNAEKKTILDFHRYLKEVKSPASFVSLLHATAADVAEFAKEGAELRAADAKKFEAIIVAGKYVYSEKHKRGIYLVYCDDFKMWGDLGTYYFDSIRGERSTSNGGRGPASVLAILTHGTGANQVPVGQTKFTLRRDNFADVPLNLVDIAQCYTSPDGRKGGGLEGAASFIQDGSLTPQNEYTPFTPAPTRKRTHGEMENVDLIKNADVKVIDISTYTDSTLPRDDMLRAAGIDPVTAKILNEKVLVKDKVAFSKTAETHYKLWSKTSAEEENIPTAGFEGHIVFGGACPMSTIISIGMQWPALHHARAQFHFVSKDLRSGELTSFTLSGRKSGDALLTCDTVFPAVGQGEPANRVFYLTSEHRLRDTNAVAIRTALGDPAAKIIEIYPKNGKLTMTSDNVGQVASDIFDIVRYDVGSYKTVLVAACPQAMAYFLGKEMQNNVFGGARCVVVLEFKNGNYHVAWNTPAKPKPKA